MRIKVCGVTRDEDVLLACELGAWAVGFIFVSSSPRAIDLELARRLRSAVSPPSLCIGVFADEDPARVREAARRLSLDAVQLHGSESPQACAELGVPAYKALTVACLEDLALAEGYAGRVAGLLVETVRRGPGGRERVDADEQRARWLLARGAGRLGSFLLAGELTPDNVAEAVRAAQPTGVDVCGGVEASPGKKDPERLRAFFRAVRGVEVR